MQLTNEFKVNVPVEEAWAVLTDIERIAPCLPGAELRDVEGDDYLGVVKVKVGPITTEYRGKARFLELDTAGYRAVLRAEGRETRGQGNASATITATLEPSEASTTVLVITEMTVSGRVAQLGRGVLADVSNKLMSQFADCLEQTLVPTASSGSEGEAAPGPAAGNGSVSVAEPAGDGAEGPDAEQAGPGQAEQAGVGQAGVGQAGPGQAGTDQVREVSRPTASSVDLVKVAGPPVFKRLLPVLVVAAFFGLWLLRKQRRSGGSQRDD
jgi:uncharacterized protein